MDGVIVNNTKYHVLNWIRFAKRFGIKLSSKTVRTKFLGKFARETIRQMLGQGLTNKEIEKLDIKREAYYRKIYAPYIKPLSGLKEFLESLKQHKVKIALATAAPTVNVNFVLGRTGVRKYFHTIVDSKGVKHGKPDPEIFLKAAKKLKVSPKKCVVFEDSLNGIKAGQRAKMKVIAVATSHHPKELSHANLVIKDFRKITINKLLKFI